MKRILRYICLVVLFLSACNVLPAPVSTPTPTLSSTQPARPTALPSATRPPTATPFSSTAPGTPYPSPSRIILPDYLASLTELARWGKGAINHVAYSKDGSQLLVSTPLATYIYSADTFSPVQQFPVRGFSALSPDGTLLAVAGGIWSTKTGRQLSKLETKRATRWEFTPDSNLIAAPDGDSIELLSVKDGVSTRSIQVVDAGSIFDLALSPDGQWAAVGTSLGYAQVIDLASGKVIHSFQPEKEAPGATDFQKSVQAVAFSPDGNRLACGTGLGISLYQLSDKSRLVHTAGSASRLAYSPDGSLLAGSNDGDAITLWSAATGQTLLTLPGNTGGVLSLSFSPDGVTLMAAGGDSLVRFWQASTGKLASVFSAHAPAQRVVVFSPDGSTTASGSCQGIQMRKVIDGSLVFWIGKGCISALAFSPDGKILASASDARDPVTGKTPGVSLWNSVDGSLLTELEGHTTAVESLAFSPDGKTFASASVGETDGVIDVWSVSDRKLLTTLTHSGIIVRVAFSRDGKVLAVHTDKKLLAWDAATYRLRYEQDLSSSQAHLVFSPDGQYLLTADGTSMRMLNPSTGDSLYIFKNSEPQCMAYSPNSQLVAMGLGNGNLQIWRSEDWKLINTISSIRDSISDITFSPDGKLLAVSSLDGTVRLWGIR